LLVLGLQLRGGGNVVRGLLTLVVVFLASGSVLFAAEDFVFGPLGGGVGLLAVFVGLVAMPLLYVAVVLLFLPSSNAYTREIRRLRFAGQAPVGPPPAPDPE